MSKQSGGYRKDQKTIRPFTDQDKNRSKRVRRWYYCSL